MSAHTTSESLVTRDDAEEFARRTLKNLRHVRRAFASGEDVHVITQVTNSLLGLVVFPWQSGLIDGLAATGLAELQQEGWPCWAIHQDDDSKEKTTTIGRLVYHLRNGVAHRRLTFGPDRNVASDVVVHVRDHLSDGAPAYWHASIDAEALGRFCELLADRIVRDLQ